VLARTENSFRIYDTACKLIVAHTSEHEIYDAILLADDGYVWVDEKGIHVARPSGSTTCEGTYYNYYWHHARIAPNHDGTAIAVTDGERIWCFTAKLEHLGGIAWKGAKRYRLVSLCFSHDDRQLFAGTSIGPILAFDVTTAR
jgi:hypothetical protein